MAGIDPMYNLVNTIIDDKEVVIFLGAGASREGTQDGEKFPSFDELIDNILKYWGFDPSKKKKRFENFLTVIKKWEREKKLPARLSEFLDGEPGLAHYYLAALSIALFSKSNALLYLTTNYDDLMKKAFTDLERNPVSKFNTVVIPLRPRITGSEFQEISVNAGEHLKRGCPVILKLFGDLNSQNPIFKQEDMIFEPEVERKLVEWMKKPMIAIGYSFSDKIINELLISSRGVSPVFLVNPSSKKIPLSIKNLERVTHIKKSFSEFILDLLEIFKEKNPSIIEKADQILESFVTMPEPPPKEVTRYETRPSTAPADSFKIKPKKILILAANPKTTSRLRLDEEIREIEEGLQRAKHRDQFKIKPKLAVRLRDFRRALLDYEPQIVHFTGHGKREGLLVEDELGMSVLISTKALSGLFELFSTRVECVILTACYSAPQAKAINKHIDYVIGMRKEIKDKAAIEFAVGFYDALGAGRSVEEAFKFGCNAIQQVYPDLPEHLIPVLKKRKKV
ncbi:MAG: SIR2 family protein [Candidatus Aminicenantes bacterium]|nr:MAG: SIR2 family protein [Candidatus Aminicenantes bacterium]